MQYSRHINVARLLLEHGADVNAWDNNHNMPLHLALESGRSDVACLLVEHGVNVDVVNGKGMTAFWLASAYGY